GTNIQSAAENEGEAKYVVDLVRVIRTTRSHDHIRTSRMGQLRADLGIRVRAGEYNWILGHQLELGRLQQVRAGQTNEYIGAFHGISQCALIGLGGEDSLVLIQI